MMYYSTPRPRGESDTNLAGGPCDVKGVWITQVTNHPLHSPAQHLAGAAGTRRHSPTKVPGDERQPDKVSYIMTFMQEQCAPCWYEILIDVLGPRGFCFGFQPDE